MGLPRPFPRAAILGPGLLPLESIACAPRGACRDLRAALEPAITSVREVGGLGVHLARAIDEGMLEGPTIYAGRGV